MEGWIKIDVKSGRSERRSPIHSTNGFGNTFLYKAVKKKSPFSMYAFREGGGG